jgi:hypothetical protein
MIMTETELNRAIQYVTASTSYARDTVSDIIRTGLHELSSFATASSRRFDRTALLEYVCMWTIRKSGQPEPLVREILGCAGRWLDAESARLAHEHPELFGTSDPSVL